MKWIYVLQTNRAEGKLDHVVTAPDTLKNLEVHGATSTLEHIPALPTYVVVFVLQIVPSFIGKNVEPNQDQCHELMPCDGPAL